MKSENQNYSISGAIILGAVIIAVAVVFSNQSGTIVKKENPENKAEVDSNSPNYDIRPITDNDHIKGDPNAPITIVEYSDFECPFCQRVHPTLEQIVKDYPDVKWVYRHFPLTSIHKSAQPAAIASECVAKLGDNDAFWQFAQGLLDNQSSLNQSLYETLAGGLSINLEEFRTCLNDPQMANIVNQDINEVTKAGDQGTPFSLIIDKDGNINPISGAVPYDVWQQAIEKIK